MRKGLIAAVLVLAIVGLVFISWIRRVHHADKSATMPQVVRSTPDMPRPKMQTDAASASPELPAQLSGSSSVAKSAFVPQPAPEQVPAVPDGRAMSSQADQHVIPETSPLSRGNALGEEPQSIIMTDYRSWTIIASEIEPLDNEQSFASGGIGVANSNGMFTTAFEALVTHTNAEGTIDAIYMPGEASTKLSSGRIISTETELRQTDDGATHLTADSLTFERKN